MKKKKKEKTYPKNPNYCMITPDPKKKEEESIASTGQS